MPYDLVFDVQGTLVRVQVKAAVFISYASEIHLVEADKRQRKPKSAQYRDAWGLILQWATREETRVGSPAKFGEAGGAVIPSQALAVQESLEKV